MSYEILHQYEKAQSCYKNSIKDQDVDSKLHDFLVENYVNASEKLSAWEDISKVINPETDFDTEWKMSKYIRAASHLQIEKTDNEEILQKALQFVKKRGKDSLKDYPLEMASIFVLKGTIKTQGCLDILHKRVSIFQMYFCSIVDFFLLFRVSLACGHGVMHYT